MQRISQDIQDTFQKIQELAGLRENFISRTGQPLSLKHTCHKLGIYPTILKQLARELYENWNDIHFHWKL
jgi:hypothetical protein